jgi:signal transduction histidine kinase
LKNCAQSTSCLTATLLAVCLTVLSSDGLSQSQLVLVTTGSTMPQSLYVLWGDEYHKSHPQTQLRYLPVGTSESAKAIRIARELHDGMGQLLAAISMNVSQVEKEKAKLSPATARCVEDNLSLIGQASAEIRTMSYLLHPPLLEEVGLQSALTWYIDGFTERSKIKVALDLDSDLGRLPKDYELSLFRIAQECLTNIHCHSGSFTALVQLSRTSEEIALEVTDEGRGISQEIQLKLTSGANAGVGFRGMQERARLVGGTLTVHSNGNGTSVRVVLPLTKEAVASGESKKLKPDEKYEGRRQKTKSPAGRSQAVRRP